VCRSRPTLAAYRTEKRDPTPMVATVGLAEAAASGPAIEVPGDLVD